MQYNLMKTCRLTFRYFFMDVTKTALRCLLEFLKPYQKSNSLVTWLLNLLLYYKHLRQVAIEYCYCSQFLSGMFGSHNRQNLSRDYWQRSANIWDNSQLMRCGYTNIRLKQYFIRTL